MAKGNGLSPARSTSASSSRHSNLAARPTQVTNVVAWANDPKNKLAHRRRLGQVIRSQVKKLGLGNDIYTVYAAFAPTNGVNNYPAQNYYRLLNGTLKWKAAYVEKCESLLKLDPVTLLLEAQACQRGSEEVPPDDGLEKSLLFDPTTEAMILKIVTLAHKNQRLPGLISNVARRMDDEQNTYARGIGITLLRSLLRHMSDSGSSQEARLNFLLELHETVKTPASR